MAQKRKASGDLPNPKRVQSRTTLDDVGKICLETESRFRLILNVFHILQTQYMKKSTPTPSMTFRMTPVSLAVVFMRLQLLRCRLSPLDILQS